MLLHELIQNRHQVIIPNGNISVLIGILVFRLSIFIQNHLVSKAVTFHVNVIIHIVLGHDKGLLALRKHNLLLHHFLRSVRLFLHFRQIMHVYHHVASIVHFLDDFLKLRNGGHYGIELLSLMGVHQSPGGIHNQDMEENVGDIIHIGGNQLALLLFILRNLRGNLRIGRQVQSI